MREEFRPGRLDTHSFGLESDLIDKPSRHSKETYKRERSYMDVLEQKAYGEGETENTHFAKLK